MGEPSWNVTPAQYPKLSKTFSPRSATESIRCSG
jgi:hypothetical protein